MSIDAHDIATAILAYLAIGSMIWLWLYASGIVEEIARRREARGIARPTKVQLVLASAIVIVAWPRAFAWLWRAAK